MYGIKKSSFNTPKTNAILGCVIVFTFFIWIMVLSPDHGGLVNKRISDKLRIDFLNVGQGDSILIQTPLGKVFLIDGGPNYKKNTSNIAREDVFQYITGLGIRHLDGLIVTHWHSDHIAGLINVIKRISIDCVYEPPYEGKGFVYDEYKKVSELVKLKRVQIHSEQTMNCGNELYVQILNPDANQDFISHSDQNNSSIVILIRYGKVQTLLCADIEKEAMRELMKYGDGIKSQIIKVPNHGAEASFYLPFIKQVSANASIISVGANNSLGHPSSHIIEAYKKNGAKIYETSINGTVKAIIGGKDENDFTIKCVYE